MRRAPAVRAVVAGLPLSPVSPTCHVAHAALRPWGPRLAQAGPPGLRERARAGRPRTITGALEQPRALLTSAGFPQHVGEKNFVPHVDAALNRAREIHTVGLGSTV